MTQKGVCYNNLWVRWTPPPLVYCSIVGNARRGRGGDGIEEGSVRTVLALGWPKLRHERLHVKPCVFVYMCVVFACVVSIEFLTMTLFFHLSIFHCSLTPKLSPFFFSGTHCARAPHQFVHYLFRPISASHQFTLFLQLIDFEALPTNPPSFPFFSLV